MAALWRTQIALNGRQSLNRRARISTPFASDMPPKVQIAITEYAKSFAKQREFQFKQPVREMARDIDFDELIKIHTQETVI